MSDVDNEESISIDKKTLENLEECTDFLRVLLFNGVKEWSGYENSVKQLEQLKKLKVEKK